MALRFLISGTDTSVGKTTVGCALAFGFKARGMRVGVMKPVETGCPERDGKLQPLDAIALCIAASSSHPVELICPYRYRAPLAPVAAAELEGAELPELGRIESAYRKIEAESDVTLVEGAGGLMVPIGWRENFADLALALKVELVLVVANRIGCLNATLLSLEYAKRRGLGVRGYVLNDSEPGPSLAAKTNADSLGRLTDVQCLGHIRHKTPPAPELFERLLRA